MPLLSSRVAAARRSKEGAFADARAAHKRRKAAEHCLKAAGEAYATLEATSAAAAEAATAAKTRTQRDLSGEKKKAEAAVAVAEQAASELASIARKQEALKRALKNAGVGLYKLNVLAPCIESACFQPLKSIK
jgi:hypothetical protein